MQNHTRKTTELIGEMVVDTQHSKFIKTSNDEISPGDESTEREYSQ